MGAGRMTLVNWSPNTTGEHISIFECHESLILKIYLDRAMNCRYNTMQCCISYLHTKITFHSCQLSWQCYYHYNDVIMSAMASQIIRLTIVYSTVKSRCRSKKTSKLRVSGLCVGNSPVTKKANNAENISIWWRHHDWEIVLPHPTC